MLKTMEFSRRDNPALLIAFFKAEQRLNGILGGCNTFLMEFSSSLSRSRF